jgi:hypothetical protein
MPRTLILLVGAAAAAAAALLAAAALRLDDGSFTPKAPTEFVRRGATDSAAPALAPRSGSLPAYVTGTDNLARDRQALEAADPPEAKTPAAPADPAEPLPAPAAPDSEPTVAAEPPD